MAKEKYKYFLNTGVSGDLHMKAPEGRKAGGKFILDKATISQEDLEYLYENGQQNIVTRVLMPTVNGEKKEVEKKKTK
ncbi:MAG: hypothetical protein AAB649_01535 [Patescibacteria group bacterium]